MSDTEVEFKAAVETVIDGIGRTVDISVGQVVMDSRGRGQYLAELFCIQAPDCRTWAVIPHYIWELSRNADAQSQDLVNMKRIVIQTLEELDAQKVVDR